MGRPRFSMGNHMEMIDGAMTPITPTPKPSMTRLSSKTAWLGEKRPMKAPITEVAMAAKPMLRAPNLRTIPAVGRAKTMPKTPDMEEIQPAVCAVTPSCCIKTGIIGMILFCPHAMATPTTKTEMRTIQGFFMSCCGCCTAACSGTLIRGLSFPSLLSSDALWPPDGRRACQLERYGKKDSPLNYA